MRLGMSGLGLVCLLLTGLPGSALGETRTDALFDVRLGAVRLGEMRLTGHEMTDGRYAARARFSTRGLAGVLARVRFDLLAEGSITEGRVSPQGYVEDIDTGKRQSNARLVYEGGLPRIVQGDRPVDAALDPGRQGGTLDPMSALFLALRDQAPATLCTLDTAIFDGARRAHVRLARTGEAGCVGRFERIAGYGEEELARLRSFPLWIEYAPGDGVMQATRIVVQTVYGKVTLYRR